MSIIILSVLSRTLSRGNKIGTQNFDSKTKTDRDHLKEKRSRMANEIKFI